MDICIELNDTANRNNPQQKASGECVSCRPLSSLDATRRGHSPCCSTTTVGDRFSRWKMPRIQVFWVAHHVQLSGSGYVLSFCGPAAICSWWLKNASPVVGESLKGLGEVAEASPGWRHTIRRDNLSCPWFFHLKRRSPASFHGQ